MTSLQTMRREAATHETLEDLAVELARQQETKRDYIIDTRKGNVETADGRTFLAFDDTAGAAVFGRINDHAHGQIAARLGIPKKYYDRMRADAGGLLDRNVNHWLVEKPERRMIRMLDGDVRAFVSDRFRRLDNFDLVERAVIPALADHPGVRFHVAHLTPERMVLRAVLPTVSREIGLSVGDIVQAGFQLRNSEVGATALVVEPFLWKLDCLNGMVSNVAAVKSYHIGRRVTDADMVEGAALNFANDTVAADDKATFLKCRDAVKAALSTVVMDEIVGQIRAAANGEAIRNPAAATEQLSQTFDLDGDEAGSVLMSLARGGQFSRWGMVNAITDAAKLAETFDRQEEMERIGGVLLTQPEHEWQRIALATAGR